MTAAWNSFAIRPADAMHMVQTGMLNAYVAEGTNAAVPVGRMGPGSLVGEIALLRDGRRNATVTTAESETPGRFGA